MNDSVTTTVVTISVVFATVVIVVVSLVIRRKQLSPKKPILTCFLDTIFEPLQYFKLGEWGISYTIDSQLEVAMKMTKLYDLNIDKNEKYSVLDRYRCSYNASLKKCFAEISPLGHIVRSRALNKRLTIRLEMVEYIKKYP